MLDATRKYTNATSNARATDSEVWITGWVPSPDGRGTFDIIQICVTTVFLCTYTTLYLNSVQTKGGRNWAVVYHKTKWALFTVFCPEMMMAIAAEQWRSAQQSIEDFASLSEQIKTASTAQGAQVDDEHLKEGLKTHPWTARHAFFTDMGGLLLECPDFRAFPINSHQLYVLVKSRHVHYPRISSEFINDKNKADFFARGATLLQIAWFTVQSIARGVLGLGITTLELSTTAFVLCTLHSMWFWRNKPLDVADPITISSLTTLAEIIRAQNGSLGLYKRTPLDFLESAPRLSYVEPFFWGVRTVFGIPDTRPEHANANLPVSSFPNTATIPPRGLLIWDVAFAITFSLTYFGIHLAAWSFPFPTHIERLFWRIAALCLVGTVTLYLIGCWPGNYFGRLIFKDSPPFALQQAKKLPAWGANMFHIPVMIAYFVCRSYIIAEGFVSLRSLPSRSYASVEWWSFLPHL